MDERGYPDRGKTTGASTGRPHLRRKNDNGVSVSTAAANDDFEKGQEA